MTTEQTAQVTQVLELPPGINTAVLLTDVPIAMAAFLDVGGSLDLTGRKSIPATDEGGV